VGVGVGVCVCKRVGVCVGVFGMLRQVPAINCVSVRACVCGWVCGRGCS